MPTNKERGYYEVEYICINCGNKTHIKRDFGKSIPTMMLPNEWKKAITSNYAEVTIHYHLEAPECSVCGCFHWSYGKVVS